MDHSDMQMDWETIYWEQMPRIYNFFRYRVCDDALAEDLTAATFERAWRYRDRYQHDKASFSTWLFTIARNLAANHFRKSNREVPLREIPLENIPPLADERSLEDIVQHRNDLAVLAQIIGSLSERDREIISLKYGADLTNRAIADIIGLSESNVGTILYRAVRQLRAQWETAQ